MNLFKLLARFGNISKRIDKRTIQQKKNDDATMFTGKKEFDTTSITVYKVSNRYVRNWNNGQKHPSYMNPAYRPAQQFNKRMK